MTSIHDLAALVHLAESLARSAGTMARDGRADHGVSAATTKSSATDVVTEYDRASETLIVDGIRAARPDDAIIGEEGTDTEGTSGVHWLIDPIDGTTNFLYGLPGWAVSIAACDDDGGLAAAVYVPATDEMFTATRGGGARLNGTPIRCSTTSDLALALVATGFSYQPQRRAVQAARLTALLPRVRDIRRMGAAATDLCSVAAGRLDAYFEEHLGPWDLAAGELIAREAGCAVGSIDGGPVRPASVFVSNPLLFDRARSLVHDLDADLLD